MSRFRSLPWSVIPLLLHTAEHLPECPTSMENIRLHRALGDSQHPGDLRLRVTLCVEQHHCESLSLGQRRKRLPELLPQVDLADFPGRVVPCRRGHIVLWLGCTDPAAAA